jgi:hypothetical protein
MTSFFRQLFWFILRHFESGDEPYAVKPLNRKVLIAVGVLFNVLWIGGLYLYADYGGFAFMLPTLIFIAVGTVCLVVGLLGSDRAVAKIWGSH